MGAAGAARRGAMMLATVFMATACGVDESPDVAASTLDPAGLAVASSEGDVIPTADSPSGTAGEFSDAHLLGFLGMVDNSEIEAAKVARERGSSSTVKEFARSMEAEHTDFLHRTRELAREIEIDIEPPAARELERMHLEAMETLGRQPRGSEFDRAYIAGQLKAHERVLEFMESAAAQQERHPRLALHLQAGIATIQQHRDRAKGVLQGLEDTAFTAR